MCNYISSRWCVLVKIIFKGGVSVKLYWYFISFKTWECALSICLSVSTCLSRKTSRKSSEYSPKPILKRSEHLRKISRKTAHLPLGLLLHLHLAVDAVQPLVDAPRLVTIPLSARPSRARVFFRVVSVWLPIDSECAIRHFWTPWRAGNKFIDTNNMR